MNGLSLRINKSSGKKTKSNLSVPPLNISSVFDESNANNKLLQDFVHAQTTDEQLSILKNIFDEVKSDCDENIIHFFVTVFFHAELKHPVKCFLTRHVSKNKGIEDDFSNALASQIKLAISSKHSNYQDYVAVVSKLAPCLENFNAGSAAIKIVEYEVAAYLVDSLNCCILTLRDPASPSPTEKNEIFNVAHLALRLLLFIIQKVSSGNTEKLVIMFTTIRIFINFLLFNYDVPMDTKSVCGILYLTMQVLEHGPDSWKIILHPKEMHLLKLLDNDASQLSLYSAIATVIPIDTLHLETVDGKSAVIMLAKKILDIGERCPSESTITLGVTRTLVQISKFLDKIECPTTGLQLIDCLLVFVWRHLEHYMDSVRHLTAQMLTNVVKYCVKLRDGGNDAALNNLYNTLTALDKTRKSYYVSLTSMTAELGAVTIMDKFPEVINEVIDALNIQAVQASATTTLENLLQKHVKQSSTEVVYETWIRLILAHVANNTLDSSVINILENLLAKAVKLDENLIDYIIPYIKNSSSECETHDLRCILMLLSVARKSGVAEKLAQNNRDEWKRLISYDVLKMAAVNDVDETRILSLSLIVESPKTTEVFTVGDFKFILYYLKYNINTQSPNFRQLTLSMMKKFVKRLEESYKVMKKQMGEQEDYYLRFFEELRALCFASLIPGANYSRRVVALQILSWCEQLSLDGYNRIWNENYVDKLLSHLEDSYENNKAFALDILNKCPTDLLKSKTYSISLAIEDILQQASSLKPTDCISAAYKFNLVKNKLPETVLGESQCAAPEAVTLALLRLLQGQVRSQLAVCVGSVVAAAGRAPLYGLLHCMHHLVARLDAFAISNDSEWSSLAAEMVTTSMEVTAAVACVVNNSSPEGHLPMDMGGVTVSDYGNSGEVRLDDGRQVTAQMVLLCAWRSVKEVSLLLGEMSSRLTIREECDSGGTLTADQLTAIGDHFTSLLAETKHRGAFEQAYVGFTKLLARLWRCRSPSLHRLPRTWLSSLMAALEALAAGGGQGKLCATRRSAGLPFMIQALVTTELQVLGNPKCFHECMSTLLRLATTRTDATETPAAIETRTHSINILRALFRNAALEEAVAGYAAEGLVAAITGFEGRTWMERNSSTLLFSALMVRIFGVQRSRDADALCTRNRMTGRIFFLRYPMLYDFMLEKLQEGSFSEDMQIRPSLYPILLLLARLYPSSLEGTVSNLKLVEYIPYVDFCGNTGVLKTRQLAAKALVPLIAPDEYDFRLLHMLTLLSDPLGKNSCHGVLLQLIRLLDARPETLVMNTEMIEELQVNIGYTMWSLGQTLGTRPCYLLADDYIKFINLIILRIPNVMNLEIIKNLGRALEGLLFVQQCPSINLGRDVCQANALYLYFIMLNKYSTTDNVVHLLLRSLSHPSYEVTITALNYLLILHKKIGVENKFHQNLQTTSNGEVLSKLRENSHLVEALCMLLKTNKYLECLQKTLIVLSMEEETEKFIVQIKLNHESADINDRTIISTLVDCIENEHENLTPMYLQCLSNFVTKQLQRGSIRGGMLLDVLRVIYASSSSDNTDDMRSVAVEFVERNIKQLLVYNSQELSADKQFEYKATVYAMVLRMLEDDDPVLRQRTSNAVRKLSKTSGNEISTKCLERLRAIIEIEHDNIALFTVLALLDFKSEVCMTDDVSDDCRVFDHNEKYNIFLEETVWTNMCADEIVKNTQFSDRKVELVQYVENIINNPLYSKTFENLCGNNLLVLGETLGNIRSGIQKNANVIVNPKIEIFCRRLLG